MERVKINMIGGGFQHAYSSSGWNHPKHIEWDKTNHESNISIHIDTAIYVQPNKSKKNYAWFAESSSIISNLIELTKTNITFLEENYELIFTHDQRLLLLSNKFRLVLPNAVPWILDSGVHKKSKLISMIASSKRFCHGHAYRQQIVEKYRSKLDLYGFGYNDIEKKEIGLNDYCFSIAMENDNYPNIFCEKITDCFATGTIPIFWGAPTIGEFFNENGIIFLTDNFKIEDLSVDLYNSKMEYVLDNYERAINLPIAEDYIFLNFIK